MGSNVSDSILTLAFAYVVLVLPYCYRALDSAWVRSMSRPGGRGAGRQPFDDVARDRAERLKCILNATLLSVALVPASLRSPTTCLQQPAGRASAPGSR
jgi:hypothetical protein